MFPQNTNHDSIWKQNVSINYEAWIFVSEAYLCFDEIKYGFWGSMMCIHKPHEFWGSIVCIQKQTWLWEPPRWKQRELSRFCLGNCQRIRSFRRTCIYEVLFRNGSLAVNPCNHATRSWQFGSRPAANRTVGMPRITRSWASPILDSYRTPTPSSANKT